jgi:hypothetical protein
MSVDAEIEQLCDIIVASFASRERLLAISTGWGTIRR